ncbi:uncharacterized protein LOC133493831 isoform X2 [Syngnathoides biaculeatus]|uniref:uncharacterized protein LOC133493831 isoform X2 n=1 Tax=Syngnathoides biaculeatus TaxID=300417 RepID=UPI002ADE226F|nr:uncharacterized protein LOC133493831 isoform X2 [Syngnathoides biaculeatus]
MSFPDAHSERISFHVFNARSSDIILGSPWLKEHNPHIDWSDQDWGEDCRSCCFAVQENKDIQVASVWLTEPSTAPELTAVPSWYHDLREVFSESKAKSLPPHRSYDCTIELLPGTSPPRGKLFSLTGPEHQAIRDYIEDSLAAALIRPSSSPAGAGFFFCQEEGLHAATLRRLPRTERHHSQEQVREVLRRLLQHQLFINLDKCEFNRASVSFLGFVLAEGEMRMDPGKVDAVLRWPTPASRKDVERFLGFANFYRRFIRNFSSVAAPLRVLTSPRNVLVWSRTCQVAFNRLKESEPSCLRGVPRTEGSTRARSCLGS